MQDLMWRSVQSAILPWVVENQLEAREGRPSRTRRIGTANGGQHLHPSPRPKEKTRAYPNLTSTTCKPKRLSQALAFGAHHSPIEPGGREARPLAGTLPRLARTPFPSCRLRRQVASTRSRQNAAPICAVPDTCCLAQPSQSAALSFAPERPAGWSRLLPAKPHALPE